VIERRAVKYMILTFASQQDYDGATLIFGQTEPGPDAPIGWPNPLLTITYCIWLSAREMAQSETTAWADNWAVGQRRPGSGRRSPGSTHARSGEHDVARWLVAGTALLLPSCASC
jgi:hypothetical protein